MSPLKRIFYYSIALLAPLVPLWILLDLDLSKLGTPQRLVGDIISQFRWLKALSEGLDLRNAASVQVPFGYDFYIHPLNNHVEIALALLCTKISGSIFFGLNVAWIVRQLLTSLLATWAFRALEISPRVSLLGGMLFSFIPFILREGIHHYSLSNLFTAAIGAAALLMLQGRFWSLRRHQTAVFFACFVLVGFGEPYAAFFSCIVLGLAGFFLLVARNMRDLLGVVIALALIVGCSFVNSLPALDARDREGVPLAGERGPEAVVKRSVFPTDLVVPPPQHRSSLLESLRTDIYRDGAVMGVARTDYVGAYGVLGLALLASGIGLVAVRRDGTEGWHKALVAPALMVGAIGVVSISGGLNTLLSRLGPLGQIRHYHRIGPFIAFFAFVGTGFFLDWLLRRTDKRPRVSFVATVALFGVVFPIGLYDQTYPLDKLAKQWKDTQELHSELREFVDAVERRLPKGAWVLQSPISFPQGPPGGPKRPRLTESNTVFATRTSWSFMYPPTQEMRAWTTWLRKHPDPLAAALMSGFDGVTVDTRGLKGSVERYRRAFSAAEGVEVIQSGKTGFVFYDISQARRALISNLGQNAYRDLQELVLKIGRDRWNLDVVVVTAEPVQQSLGGLPQFAYRVRFGRPGSKLVFKSARMRIAAGDLLRGTVLLWSDGSKPVPPMVVKLEFGLREEVHQVAELRLTQIPDRPREIQISARAQEKSDFAQLSITSTAIASPVYLVGGSIEIDDSRSRP